MKYSVELQQKRFNLDVSETGDRIFLSLHRKSQEVLLLDADPPSYTLLWNDKVLDLIIERAGENCVLEWEGARYQAKVKYALVDAIAGEFSAQPRRSEQVLKSPLPGIIHSIQVKPGERVHTGQGLLIIEAMKMENQIKSPVRGSVREILVTEREPVEKDQVLLNFDLE